MKSHSRFRQALRRRSRLLLPLAICCLGSLLPAPVLALSPVPSDKPSGFPDWWFTRDVIKQVHTTPESTPSWAGNDYPATNDFAMVNQGQLKRIVEAAFDEFESRSSTTVPGGAGPALTDIVGTWRTNVLSAKDDYSAVNVGQVKVLAALIYDRLGYAGYKDQAPWAYSSSANDFAAATIGQVKELFSFDVTSNGPNRDAITHEVWTGGSGGIVGTNLGDIPLGTTPSNAEPRQITTGFQGLGGTGTNYGERLRGYIRVPSTGVYQFTLTAVGSAQFHLSNDADPVNLFLRAEVKDVTSSTSNKTSLLWLEQGRRYYVEVLHKVGTTAGGVSISWITSSQDPDTATPVLVPASALTRRTSAPPPAFTPPAALSWSQPTSGADSHLDRNAATRFLIQATFGPSGWKQEPVYTHCNGSGHDGHLGELCLNCTACTTECPNPTTCTYRIDPDGTGPLPAVHPVAHGIHSDACGGWAQRANLSLAPTLAELDSSNKTPYDVLQVQSMGFKNWIAYQIALPKTKLYPLVDANHSHIEDVGQHQYWHTQFYRAWWRAAITAPDQLRQRVAFALSQTMVVGSPALVNKSDATSAYYDVLIEHAFTDDFRTLLKAVTLQPAMGLYLDMLRNDKPQLISGVTRLPNENYARELLQLFSLGLNRLNPDGTLLLNGHGQPIPTYDQPTVEGLARVFTGWGWYYPDSYATLPPSDWRYLDLSKGPYKLVFDYGNPYYTLNAPLIGDYLRGKEPMRQVPSRHYTGPKRILNNVVLPGMPKYDSGTTGSPNIVTLDAMANHANMLALTKPTIPYNEKFNELPEAELDAVIDAIVAHPNCGPFICRQLIQRLVTSDPSPDYVYRVASIFNDDNISGSHKRGNMAAVIEAILTDHDARSSEMLSISSFGKQREPVCRITALARAFPTIETVGSTTGATGTLPWKETPGWNSSWNMNMTSFVASGAPNLNQTPLGAPSVFNFYRPDYMFPGELAKAGVITPEFQLTTGSSVLDQSNFVHGALHNWANDANNGRVSFPMGQRAVCMDQSPWKAYVSGTSGPFRTDNDYLSALLDGLNTHLMAGQLKSTGTNDYPARNITNPKQAIIDFVSTKELDPAVIPAPGAPIILKTKVPHCLVTGDKVFFSRSIGNAFQDFQRFTNTTDMGAGEYWPQEGTPLHRRPYDNEASLFNGWPTICFAVTVLSPDTFQLVGTRKTDGSTVTLGTSYDASLGKATISLLPYDSPAARIDSIITLLANSPEFIIQR